MWKIVLSFCITSFLFGEMLEVNLPTRSYVKRLYIGRTADEYLEDLRKVLTFDLTYGGFVSVDPICQELEERLELPFSKTKWDPFSYLFSLQKTNNQLVLSITDVEKGTVKKYPPLQLSGKLDVDRRVIHLLSDSVHKELFGESGIASLKILYTKREKNPSKGGLQWLSEVWISDYDGKNARQLTQTGGYCLSPGFLPSKKEVDEFFYVFHDEGQSKIYRAFLSNPQDKKQWINLRGNQLLPAVSMQGNAIAFIADLAGRPDLFLQNLDSRGNAIGKPKQLYSTPRATQASPTFSPDGKTIAFVSDKEGTPRIYLVEANNPAPKPKLLTKKYRDNTAPSWSPDGKKIAYAAKVDGVRQICLYDLSKEEEICLTKGFDIKENPSWAPDSAHLLFNTENDASSELYLLSIQTGESVQLTEGRGQKRFGSWEMKYDIQ